MLTRAFSDILVFIQSFFQGTQTLVLFTHITSTSSSLSASNSSLLVAALAGIWFGGIFFYFFFFYSRHAPPVVENAQSVFLFPSGFVVQDANRPAGCAFAVARSREMMLVPVCSAQFLSLSLFFFGFSLLLSLDLF